MTDYKDRLVAQNGSIFGTRGYKLNKKGDEPKGYMRAGAEDMLEKYEKDPNKAKTNGQARKYYS